MTTDMQIDQEKLKAENAKLVAAFREKTRKYQQTQELYDRLKRKEMTAVTQSAAFESVDEVLQSVSSHQGSNGLAQHAQYHGGFSPTKQLSTTQKVGSLAQAHPGNIDNENMGGNERMMPPPFLRPGHPFGNQIPLEREYSQLLADETLNLPHIENEMDATPSNHRMRLGSFIPSVARQQAQGTIRNSRMHAPATSHGPDQIHRRPFLSTSINRSNVGGYGMSAGMKIGRQQGEL